MKPYESFVFHRYAYHPGEGRIELVYKLDDEIEFIETLILKNAPMPRDPEALDRALFALHLVGGISYYKTFCPAQIEVRSGELTIDQADFWDTVYTKGLGEFFYKNKIDFKGLINFPIHEDALAPSLTSNKSGSSRVLVPIGGGKDSVVTMELLKKAGADVTLFRIGNHPLIEQQAAIADLPIITIERHLSPRLFELNAKGALNGHVPVTAYLSCVTAVIAELYGFDTVVMSNERSANEGNVEYLDEEINHQWSKSVEFEKMFQTYLKENISPDLSYFSLLRPWSELKIAEIFSQYPHYFDCTTSCNANWRIWKEKPTDLWDPKDPKSAFVFLLLSAFLPEETLKEIFKQNYLANTDAIPLYKELLGTEGIKPFECVGTPDEVKAAFLLAHERGDYNDMPVMKMFLTEVVPTVKDQKKLIASVLEASKEHAIPKEFQPIIDAH